MKRTNSILLTVLIFLAAASAFATAQYPDKIVYNGQRYKLHSNPLEEYFSKFPEKKPRSGVVSSALWRGYIATFEIADKALVLKDIEVMAQKKNSRSFETEWKSVLKEVFPDGKTLKIDWFTGLLVLPHGEMVNYVHMGYGSTYEHYILLEISGGDFQRAKEFEHKEYEKFKARQFEAFKLTDEYRKLVDEFKKREDYAPDFVDSFLRDFITNYTSKILVD